METIDAHILDHRLDVAPVHRILALGDNFRSNLRQLDCRRASLQWLIRACALVVSYGDRHNGVWSGPKSSPPSKKRRKTSESVKAKISMEFCAGFAVEQSEWLMGPACHSIMLDACTRGITRHYGCDNKMDRKFTAFEDGNTCLSVHQHSSIDQLKPSEWLPHLINWEEADPKLHILSASTLWSNTRLHGIRSSHMESKERSKPLNKQIAARLHSHQRVETESTIPQEEEVAERLAERLENLSFFLKRLLQDLRVDDKVMGNPEESDTLGQRHSEAIIMISACVRRFLETVVTLISRIVATAFDPETDGGQVMLACKSCSVSSVSAQTTCCPRALTIFATAALAACLIRSCNDDMHADINALSRVGSSMNARINVVQESVKRTNAAMYNRLNLSYLRHQSFRELCLFGDLIAGPSIREYNITQQLITAERSSSDRPKWNRFLLSDAPPSDEALKNIYWAAWAEVRNLELKSFEELEKMLIAQQENLGDNASYHGDICTATNNQLLSVNPRLLTTFLQCRSSLKQAEYEGPQRLSLLLETLTNHHHEG